MGDLDHLAESIKATGGQPISPIMVVVEGDGYRLVDGERRYRAMCQLGTMECDAMVFPTFAEADEAIAMMATDEKKQLSETEALRGFQRMLDLGVDDLTIAGVTHRDAEKVRRVRRFAKDASEQVTLDVLFAAADEEFTDEERAAILADPWGVDCARRTKQRHERERKRAEIRDALPEGIDFRKGSAPWDPEREGLVYLSKVKSVKSAETFAKKHEGEGDLCAYEDGVAYALYSFVGQDEMDARAAEKSRLAQRVDHHKECYGAAFYEASSYLLRPWRTLPDGTLPPRVTHFEEWVKEHRAHLATERFQTAFEDMCKGYAECRPSMAEAMNCVWTQFHDGDGFIRSWDGMYNAYRAEKFVEMVDLAISDGYKPVGGDLDLYETAKKVVEKEAKNVD
jgi:ParB-like chromosome segregation protein Spo0J